MKYGIGIGLVIVIAVIGIGSYMLGAQRGSKPAEVSQQQVQTNTSTQPQATTSENSNETETQKEGKETIGESAGKHDIVAYHYGVGDKEILFVGGIHGGYGWNTSLVAYELVDYLEDNPETIPKNVRVTVIPTLNPDGLERVVGKDGRFEASEAPSAMGTIVTGRLNDNDVDLNRNFDCDWQAEGVWQNKKVSGGSSAFSEPEADALREYVSKHPPTAVIAWYSSAGGVYASNCHNGVSAETSALTSLFAKASGYAAHESFDYYDITGDMVNWFAKENVPAISVLLTNHTDVEWSKNKKGIEALLAHYAE